MQLINSWLTLLIANVYAVRVVCGMDDLIRSFVYRMQSGTEQVAAATAELAASANLNAQLRQDMEKLNNTVLNLTKSNEDLLNELRQLRGM